MTRGPDAPSEHDSPADELEALRRRVAELERLLDEERQERERELEEQERLQTFSEVTNDWLWEVDASAVYTYVSPKVRDLLGYEPEEVIGRTPFDLMPPEEAERVGEIFRLITSGRRPFSLLENTNLHRSGMRVVFETSGVPLFDKSGAFCGYRGVDRDVTERKHAEEARLRLQENIIQAQASALAELSTPLIPVGERVVAMPLVGSIDVRRAQQILERLLEGVQAARAETAILDVTGVPVMDANVAAALAQAAQGVRLLGARVILTGIRPEVATTLVQLGVDLAGITLRSTLESAIAYSTQRGGAGRRTGA